MKGLGTLPTFALATAILSPTVGAEILSVGFTDTNTTVQVKPVSDHFFNPASAIDLTVSSGLDRKLAIKLLNSSGIAVQTLNTTVVGISDRVSTLGREYYGKVVELSKPVDGEYTLVADILDLTGNVVQTDSYSVLIDTKAPTVGDPLAISYGGLDGLNLPADTWYTGYWRTNKYYAPDVADEGSGIDSVQGVTRDGATVYKRAAAIYAPQSAQAHIGNGSSWFPTDNATRVFGLQFEVTDKAGNVGFSKNQALYYDKVGGPSEIGKPYAVYDPDSTNVMGGQTGYISYSSGMTVKTNPIKIMYRVSKSNHADYSRGGIYPVGQKLQLKDIDNNYVYIVYERPYGFRNSNYVRFTDRRTWSTNGIGYNLVLSDSAPKQPIRRGNQYQYSDIGWSSWGRHINVPDMPVQVLASKIIVDARTYDQVYSHMGTCTIPAGQTECTVTYNPPKEINPGTLGNLHSGSSIKSADGSLYGEPGWASVHWNNSALPSITSTEWDPELKLVTVYATQPSRGYYFDTVRLTDAFVESNGERLSVPRTLWQENGSNYKFQFDLSSLPEGAYDIKAGVMENHQNYARKDVVSFVNDTTAPNIEVFYKGSPVPELVQGISGLTVKATDETLMSLIDIQLSGGPSSDVIYLAYSKLGEGDYKIEQPRMFPALEENQKYTLTIRMKDSFNNVGTGIVQFMYAPDNWIKVSGLKTLSVDHGLELRNGAPVAVITSDTLHTESGNLATGNQDALVTLRPDAPFPISVNGEVINPGETKALTFDLGNVGGKLNIPVSSADNEAEGIADFMLEIPELKSMYD